MRSEHNNTKHKGQKWEKIYFYFLLCFPPHLSETKNSLLPSFSAHFLPNPSLSNPQIPFLPPKTLHPFTSAHILSGFPKTIRLCFELPKPLTDPPLEETQGSITRPSMSGGARAPNRPAPPHTGMVQIPPPLPKRNLTALASTKPPFVPPDDYHRFSSAADSRRASASADHEAEAIVVRSPVSLLSYFLFLFDFRFNPLHLACRIINWRILDNHNEIGGEML